MRVPAEFAFSPERVSAMVLRYLYLLRGSVPRILDLLYWPLVQMITWGLLQTFLVKGADVTSPAGSALVAAGSLIGGLLLWDILLRGQLGFSVSFLEDMWARNIGNLLMSPLRPLEFVCALMIMSLVRLAIGLGPVIVAAYLFFGFALWDLGFGVAVFFAVLLMTSWSVGLIVAGLILRYGMGAEGLAWTIMFLIMPLACVYYPVAMLPTWLQPFAWALPPTYVFEGLRSILLDKILRWDLIAQALAMNVVLLSIAVVSFLALVKNARRAGSLLQMGE